MTTKQALVPTVIVSNVNVSPVSAADRSYGKTGAHLVLDMEINGQPAQVVCHLTKVEALTLAMLLTSEVTQELDAWPQGYSADERAAWRAADHPVPVVDLAATDAQG